MASIGIHPPETPVTKGSNGIAKATVPNVCKMPGPPAPFVPAPLPNIGKSGSSPKGYSKTVKFEGNTVAIFGCSFNSVGDMASKGTGGGLISANTHGPTKFITPGSLTVKVEGKSVHLRSESTLNNCGPSGMPPNTGMTIMGVKQKKRKIEDCPGHTLKWEDLTEKGEKDRKKRQEEKIKNHRQAIRTHEYDFDHGTGPGNPTESLRLAVVRQSQLEDDQYEQRVAEQVKAKWTGVKYWCTLCRLKGDIDIITEDGVIKECKNTGSATEHQIKNLNLVGPAIMTALGGAFKGVHVAVAAAKRSSMKDSLRDLGVADQVKEIQSH